MGYFENDESEALKIFVANKNTLMWYWPDPKNCECCFKIRF